MSNLYKRLDFSKTKYEGVSLDTLAQLVTKDIKPSLNKGLSDTKGNSKKSNRNVLKGRAVAKAVSDAFALKMASLKSGLEKQYRNTYYCSRVILQEGKQIRAKYCGQRWCSICNRIRTARLIAAYKPKIEEMFNPHFVTLTIEAVNGTELGDVYDEMVIAFKACTRNLRKTHGVNVYGIRKLETNYNPVSKTYNPHYHIVVEGCKAAFYLYSEWLRYWRKRKRKVSYKAQDLRPVKEGSEMELFKYFTKVFFKNNMYPKALDVLFKAMKGRRTVQPIGGLKKEVSEEIEEIEAQICDWLEYAERGEVWLYERDGWEADWYNAKGESLTGARLSKKEYNMLLRVEKANTG